MGDPRKVSRQFDGQSGGAAWSPDGKQLVYAAQFTRRTSGTARPRWLVIRSMETGQEHQVPLKPEFRSTAEFKKIWTPNGRSIFFMGLEREGNEFNGICQLDVQNGSAIQSRLA